MTLTAADRERLRRVLQANGVTSAKEQREGIACFKAYSLPKHAFLLQAGEGVTFAGIVAAGVLREYYVLPDGTERTRAFTFENDAFGSASDALSQRPSRIFCRAETAARVLQLSWADLGRLVAGSLEWERLRHGIIERLYLQKAEREFELMGLDAMERYLALRRKHPAVEGLVPQGLIASYLAITPVHLSRLRRRLRDEARLTARSAGKPRSPR
jgi:CRP-like cAMP-binding protein